MISYFFSIIVVMSIFEGRFIDKLFLDEWLDIKYLTCKILQSLHVFLLSGHNVATLLLFALIIVLLTSYFL